MISFNLRDKRAPVLMAAALLCAAPMLQAAPVGFGVAAASISAGSGGYGIDSGSNAENGGTLLDVRFTHSFLAQSFSLAGVGDSFSFDFATVRFNEPNTGNGANRGIRSDERDGLGVTARFDFSDPLGSVLELTAIVTATAGPIDDAAVDYAIAWSPVEADFGVGGRFRVSVDALSFSTTGAQTARASVELLSAPQQRIAQVPEPGSFALAGMALAAVGAMRRKHRA